jgi:hypothetical protein
MICLTWNSDLIKLSLKFWNKTAFSFLLCLHISNRFSRIYKTITNKFIEIWTRHVCRVSIVAYFILPFVYSFYLVLIIGYRCSSISNTSFQGWIDNKSWCNLSFTVLVLFVKIFFTSSTLNLISYLHLHDEQKHLSFHTQYETIFNETFYRRNCKYCTLNYVPTYKVHYTYSYLCLQKCSKDCNYLQAWSFNSKAV